MIWKNMEETETQTQTRDKRDKIVIYAVCLGVIVIPIKIEVIPYRAMTFTKPLCYPRHTLE
jgi:hypothetical protein